MSARAIVLEAFRAAREGVDLAGRVRDALGPGGPFVVVAAGKAATQMFAGVRAFSSALVVVPRGTGALAGPPSDPRVTVLEASHPLPDESSVRAAEAALALASSESPDERLFLISGGASSLLCAPAPGLTLARKREIVAALLGEEMPISDVNVVRRHLSRVKGGGLARACGARPRRTLIVSDVLGKLVPAGTGEDVSADVGSGPSVSDPTTIADATRVASRVGLGALPWVETWKHAERYEVIASPRLVAEQMAAALVARGVHAVAFVDAIGHDAETLANRYAKLASTMPAGDALVQAAEPFLRVPASPGRGGRCTHLAALMSTRLPPNTVFAAIATDGVDGSSGTGGAIVDGPLEGTDLALARFATGPLHLAAGTAIPSAPTGINFADLHVLMRT